jgi:FKBP-type peptidyl-prolyl cis-trans isomerase FklB
VDAKINQAMLKLSLGNFMKESRFMFKQILVLLFGTVFATSQAWSAEVSEIKTEKDKLSYSIGASIGKNLKKEETNIDLNLLIKGLKNGLAGERLVIPDKEIRIILGTYQSELRKKMMATKQQATADNKKKGDAFLTENKAKNGVKVLESGVQYTVLKAGNGRKPTEADMVVVDYRGTLINGDEFDATEQGKPATLKVASLIAGWKQALTQMPVGSKWKLYIPSQLGYGERGVGSDIGPNEVLVFEVELLSIK